MGPFSPGGGRTRSLGMAPFENVFSNRSPTRYPISPQGLPQGWIEHPVFCLQNKRFTTKLLGLLLVHREISLRHLNAVPFRMFDVPLDRLTNRITESNLF